MTNLGQVTIAGHVVEKPREAFKDEARNITRVVFRVAINDSYRDKDGQWVSKNPTYIDVVCWNQLATNVQSSVSKGTPVLVHGKFESYSWTATNDMGEEVKRNSMQIYASHVGVELSRRQVVVKKLAEEHASTQLAADGAEAPGDLREALSSGGFGDGADLGGAAPFGVGSGTAAGGAAASSASPQSRKQSRKEDREKITA